MTTFSADLETGDLSQFGTTVTDGGDLSAHADAAYAGSYGLKCVIDDTNSIYGRIDTIINASQVRAGFWFNPNSVTMNDLVAVSISTGDGNTDFRVGLRRNGSNYELFVGVDNDSATWAYDYATLRAYGTSGWHWVEYHVSRSTGAGNNDGFAKLWIDVIDGTPDAELSSVDDDTLDHDRPQFGAPVVQTSVSGTIYIDEISGNDTGDAIGPPMTAQERASIATIASVWNGPSVIPDSTIALADKQHIAWSYAGIAAQSVEGTIIPVIIHHLRQQGIA